MKKRRCNDDFSWKNENITNFHKKTTILLPKLTLVYASHRRLFITHAEYMDGGLQFTRP